MAITGKDVLKLVVDADTSGAVREFEKLGKTANKELAGAEQKSKGFSGAVTAGLDKLVAKSPMAAAALDKVGLSTAQLGAVALPALATGAGVAAGALVAFGVKSVDAFQKTALEAGKFADATGLSVEEASKYIAIADDIGVGASTIQSAFVKMEKAIDSNRAAFGDLIATARDGSVDLSGTFLNVIEHLQGIEDPIRRANEASKFFGRGFAEVAEIINTDAGEMQRALEGVSEAQVIDEAELAKARDYRAAMDKLNDAFRDIAITAGEALVPALTEAADAMIWMSNAAKGLPGPIAEFIGAMVPTTNVPAIFDDSASGVERLKSALEFANPALALFGGLFGDSGEATDDAAAATEKHATAMNALSRGYASAHGGIAGYANAMQQVNNANNQVADSVSMSREGVRSYGQALKEAEAAQRGLLAAQLAAIDSTFAVGDSYRQFQSAVDAANTTVDDGTTTMNEQQAAIDAAAQAALANAIAVAEMDRVQQEATGGTQSAKEQTDSMIGSLRTLASQASPAVAAAISGLIAKLQTYNTTEADPELTANDRASFTIADVTNKLLTLDGRRAVVDVVANAQGAANALQGIINRAERINNMVIVAGVNRKVGGPIPGPRNAPVPAVVHGGEYVLSADVVDRIKKGAPSLGADASSSLSLSASSGGGGGGTVVNFNGTFLASKAELGRMVDEAIAESRRRGNRAA